MHDDIHNALETERRRLADRMDGALINQMNLILAQINAYESAGSGGLALSVVNSLMQTLLQSTYDLINDLNPTALESLGLVPALESYAQTQRRAHGLNLTVMLDRHPERLPLPVELTLFRAAQTLTERARHANAAQMALTLQRGDDRVHFSMADNGVFDADPPLDLLRTLLTAIGADLTVDHSRYGGTEVTITLQIDPPVDLTEREQEVITLLGQGLTNREIALRLDVRPRTVKFHLDNIYAKLGVNTRTEAAIYALRHGWT